MKRNRRMTGPRGSGRTAAMLQEAISTAHTGRKALIVVANEQQRRDIVERTKNTPNIEVRSMNDLPLGTRYGRVLVDHYVYETLLDMYDSKLDALESRR